MSHHASPPWNRTVKIVVAVAALFLLVVAIVTFRSLITQLIIAAIIAYVLNPLIILIDRNTPFSRNIGILLTYIVIFSLLIGLFIALSSLAVTQTGRLITNFDSYVTGLTNLISGLLSREFTFGPFEPFRPLDFDWNSVRDQILGLANPILGRSSEAIAWVAQSALRVVSLTFFIAILSIYMSIELPRWADRVVNVADAPGYRDDARVLTRGFGRIWSAYLRGQIILGIIIFFVVWIALTILGVDNSLALGLLSGLLEFLPIIGPFIGTAAAVVVALLQDSNWLGLNPVAYAGVILAVMFLIQQLESSILVPRIVGDSLDLHPLVVIVGVLMGSSVAGILGAILAAPVLATINLLGGYAWRKMFDLPPFPETDEPELDESITWTDWLRNRWLVLRDRFSSAES